MKASVVIGANWGDEGKGLMVDCLCRKHEADIVIRFNGGSNAGHTVVTPEGQRHIFSHIGSGYYAGAATYLSEYFILNPILFRSEYESLKAPSNYNIMINRFSEITTYWDMLANRVLEEWRGEDAHGSCGVGIGSTVYRAKNIQFRLDESMVSHHELNERTLMAKLDRICSFWINFLFYHPAKNDQRIPQWAAECFNRNNSINLKYIEDLKFLFHRSIVVSGFREIRYTSRYAIFEGAQGLMLDQCYGNHPHTTWSNTGMRNVLEIQRDRYLSEKTNFDIDEIVYVSRTYFTRHGNDPAFEDEPMPEYVIDKTNIPNKWQGELKYMSLGMGHKMVEHIDTDVQANRLDRANIKLAITHTDQFNDKCVFGLKYPVGYISSGETWKDVRDELGGLRENC
jgi:adenylosuccinate synthase